MDFRFHTTQDIGHGIMIIFICCVLVILAVLFDLHAGVTAAKKNCEKLRSHIFRRTIAKTADYLRMVFFGVMIDVLGLCFPWYEIPYCTVLVTLGVLLIEAKSVLENNARSRSAVAQLPQVIQSIIEAKDSKDATAIVELLRADKDKHTEDA